MDVGILTSSWLSTAVLKSLRSMIDFVVVTSDLQPHVLDTGTELDQVAGEAAGQIW